MEPVNPAVESPLSEPARLVDTFVAPSKTFNDIRRSATWWLPFLLVTCLSLFYAYSILSKVGTATLVDGVVRASPALEGQIANATPDVAARIRSRVEFQFRLMYLAPVFLLVFGVICSTVLMATANFGFGGRASFKQMLAVWFYGTLPLSIISIITIVLVYAGVGTESFNIRNAAGTNVGYFLQDGSSPRWLVTFLSSVDIFALWTAMLLTLGVSIVAGIKRGAAAAVVFGWWFLYVLAQTGIAAMSS